ncbi:TPA: phage baseplate protein [Escherichia coli]
MAKNPFENAVKVTEQIEREKAAKAKQNQTGGRVEDARKQQQEQKTQECTIIVSGMRKGGPNEHILENADAEHIYLYFDAIPSYSYSRTVEKTQFATENRVDYSDHAVIKDKQFTLSAYINTSPTYIRQGNKIDQDTDPNNPAASMRPAKAMELLERLVDERAVISLATEEMGLLENMIITKLTARREASEGAALVVEIEFSEFRTFELYKVADATITTDPKKVKGTKNKGAVSSSSNKAADSDKFKNENTAWKGNVFDGHGYNPETGELTNGNGEVLEDFKKNGGIVTPKGYKPNVSLNRK